MSRIWFVLNQGQVFGPFSTNEVEEQLQANTWNADCRIWWRGQQEWMSADQWRRELPQIVTGQQNKEEKTWYLAVYGDCIGPLSFSELIRQIKEQKNPKDLRVWSEFLDDWHSLFNIPDVMQALGIRERKTPRAHIQGTAEFKINNSQHTFDLATLGAGGFGIKYALFLKPGQIVPVTLHSSALAAPIFATAKVLYVSQDAVTGLQFQSIAAEAKALIVSFLKNKESKKKTAQKTQKKKETEVAPAEGAIALEEKKPEAELWYLNQNEKSLGPFTKEQLIQQIRRTTKPGGVKVWSQGMNEWTHLFQIDDLIRELGLSRREHSRVPIEAQVLIIRGKDHWSAAANLISPGGIGLINFAELNPGEIVKITLQSEFLPAPFTAQASVRYLDPQKNMGLRFEEISEESRKIIQAYVDKFVQQNTEDNFQFYRKAN